MSPIVKLDKGTAVDGVAWSNLFIGVDYKASGVLTAAATQAASDVLETKAEIFAWLVKFFRTTDREFVYDGGGNTFHEGTGRVSHSYGVRLTEQGTDELAAWLRRKFG